MVTLLLVDAALELVPPELHGHPAVRADAARSGRLPGRLLLDSSYHHAAMEGLDEGVRRGRPDLVQLCLLAAQGSLLNLEQTRPLRTVVHTRQGHLITLTPDARLPHTYDRFKGLMAQLLADGAVGGGLLTLRRDIPASGLKAALGLSTMVCFDDGAPGTALPASLRLRAADGSPELGLAIGAMPHGPLSDGVSDLCDFRVRLGRHPLEAWIVVSRALALLEQQLGLLPPPMPP